MRRISFILIYLILLYIYISFMQCHQQYPDQLIVEKHIKQLIIIVGISDEKDADFFNEILRENDIVFTYGAKVNLLVKINKPRISISRQSVDDLKTDLERLGNIHIDYVNYNPEQNDSSHTSQEELNNIFNAIQKARVLANNINAKLSFGTENIMLEQYGTEIAPLVDLFGVQAQRYQTDSLNTFQKEIQNDVMIVKKGSKEVPIFVQLSFNPPKWEVITLPSGEKIKIHVIDKNGKKVYVQLKAEEILNQIIAIKGLTDGITLLYNEETKEELKKLIQTLRE